MDLEREKNELLHFPDFTNGEVTMQAMLALAMLEFSEAAKKHDDAKLAGGKGIPDAEAILARNLWEERRPELLEYFPDQITDANIAMLELRPLAPGQRVGGDPVAPMLPHEKERLEAEIQVQRRVYEEALDSGYSRLASGAVAEAAVAADFSGARASELKQIASNLNDLDEAEKSVYVNPLTPGFIPSHDRESNWSYMEAQWVSSLELPEFPLPPATDKISRHLSWLLRRGAVLEGYVVRDDGLVAARDILDFFMKDSKKRSLSVTGIKLLAVARIDAKSRFECYVERGDLLGMRAVSGHSDQMKVDDIMLLTRILLDCGPIPEFCLHGTGWLNMMRIMEEGILPGGPRQERKHVHCSPYRQSDPRCGAGMRPDVDVLIYVNIKMSIREGYTWYRSSAGAIFAPQTVNKRYFDKIVDIRARLVLWRNVHVAMRDKTIASEHPDDETPWQEIREQKPGHSCEACQRERQAERAQARDAYHFLRLLPVLQLRALPLLLSLWKIGAS